jgi:hypothetical protein
MIVLDGWMEYFGAQSTLERHPNNAKKSFFESSSFREQAHIHLFVWFLFITRSPQSEFVGRNDSMVVVGNPVKILMEVVFFPIITADFSFHANRRLREICARILIREMSCPLFGWLVGGENETRATRHTAKR